METKRCTVCKVEKTIHHIQPTRHGWLRSDFYLLAVLVGIIAGLHVLVNGVLAGLSQ